MQFYALATSPLIQKLQLLVKDVSQVWLADDATGAGKLEDLKRWWDLVIEEALTGETTSKISAALRCIGS